MTDKEIKEKIKSISETVKITKAMQMIATAQLYSLRQKSDNAKEYKRQAEEIAFSLIKGKSRYTQPLLLMGEGDNTAVIVVAGEKGMCGDYNNNVLNAADEFIAALQCATSVFPIGYVAKTYYKNKGVNIDSRYTHVFNEPSINDAKAIADELIKSFLYGGVKQVYIIYTEAVTPSKHEICTQKLLPMDCFSVAEADCAVGKADCAAVLREALAAQLYYAMATATLAVNYKRMVAMQQATSNGEKLAEELSLKFNRSRQDKITNELNDATAVLFGRKL